MAHTIKTATFRLVVTTEREKQLLDRACDETERVLREVFRANYALARNSLRRIRDLEKTGEKTPTKADIIQTLSRRMTLSLYKTLKGTRALPSGIKSSLPVHLQGQLLSYVDRSLSDPHTGYPYRNDTTTSRGFFKLTTSNQYGFILMTHRETGHLHLYLNLFSIADRIPTSQSMDMTMYAPVGAVRPNRKAKKGASTIKVVEIPPRQKSGLVFSLDYSHTYHKQQFVQAGGIPKSLAVTRNGDAYYAHIAFEFPVRERDPVNVAGINRGITNLLGVVVINPSTLEPIRETLIDGNEFNYVKTKERNRRRKLQQDGRARTGNRERERIENIIERASIQVTHLLIETNSRPSWDQLKNFTNGPQQRRAYGGKRTMAHRLLPRAAYARLLNRTASRLIFQGLAPFDAGFEMNSYHISIRCRKCGFIHEENRSSTNLEQFQCVRCGWVDHADLNAAYNLAAKRVFHMESMVKNASKKPGQRVVWAEFEGWFKEKTKHRYELIPMQVNRLEE